MTQPPADEPDSSLPNDSDADSINAADASSDAADSMNAAEAAGDSSMADAPAGAIDTPPVTGPSVPPAESDPGGSWAAPAVSQPAAPTWGAPDYAFTPASTPYAAVGGPPSTTSAKAIASLVLSLLWFCGVGSLVAVILGHLARGDIKRSQGRVGGLGVATAGLVIGYLGLAFTLVVGGVLTVAAIDAGVGTARQSEGSDTAPGQVPAPESSDAPRQVQPVSGVCPDVSALDNVVPPGSELVLFNSTRGVEDGVVECLYTIDGRPPAQAPYVLVALQDDVTTLSVDDYFAERELAPPTDAQLGAAKGTADKFGYDTYDSPGSNIAYVDTGAARGDRSVVLSVPASFEIDEPVLFATTVDLLDGIRVPDNVI